MAINTPVRLLHGVSKLDEFYRAPLAWPAAERTSDIENTFLKVADLSKRTLTPQTSLPFNAIESKFLIGLSFRFDSAGHYLQQPAAKQPGRAPTTDCGSCRREPVYHEILQYSYEDYFEKFAVPYYQATRHGIAGAGTGKGRRPADL